MTINTVTVIGATGTMGANVAGIFASFGSAKVYIVGRNITKVKNTIPRIVNSVRSDAIAGNLFPVDFSMLEKCVSESDLVFESSAENMEIKKSIHEKVGKFLRLDAIACSGTSGLSIAELAGCYPDEKKKNFFGIHFFNPPYSMSLCELTATEYSDTCMMESLHSYLDNELYRTVIEVEDSPAFLANRIGFYFINSALQAAEKYSANGGIDYIDSILGPFTGRNMAPITTADFVGLDVHKAIVNNIYDNSDDYAHDAFILPKYVQRLIDEGNLGTKMGCGLYKMDKSDGCREMLVWDIENNKYRKAVEYSLPFVEKMRKLIAEGNYEDALTVLLNDSSKEGKICVEFLLKYIVYAIFAADQLGDSVEAADDAMATGFNWCPPLALFQALSSVTDVETLIKDRIPNDIRKVKWEILSNKIIPSKYDYRLYFKSGK